MKDISQVISECSRWSTKEHAEAYSRQVQRDLQCSIDWDPDAGEAWIRLHSKSDVLVLVHTGLKLVLEQVKVNILKTAHPDIQVIKFSNYDGPPEFCMQPEKVRHLGVDTDVWNEPGPNPEGFNANDLWFLSV